MDRNPNVPRKSLSLGNKLHKKKHNDAPVREVAATAATSKEITDTKCANATVEIIDSTPACSPPVTPPSRYRRKSIISLDDSIDSSPRLLDCSYSPSFLLSQTLGSDSPEVNWRWSRKSAIENNAALHKNSEEAKAKRALSDSRKERRKILLANNENRRRQQELELRRAQQTRAHELLAERCAKLQKQFGEVEVNEAKNKQQVPEQRRTTRSMNNNHSPMSSNAIHSSSNLSTINENKRDLFSSKAKPLVSSTITSTVNSKPSIAAVAKKENSESTKSEFDDFFNDSDTDDFLLAATQQWESEVVSQTQQIQKNGTKLSTPVSAANVSNHIDTYTMATTTPKSSHKVKSSLYMQFLEDEDESFDEWFTALDEAEREATQPKKPRTSLQRYKSMPDKTTTSCTSTKNTEPKSSTANVGGAIGQTTAVVTPTSTRIKRCASSHALSPVARSKFFGNRK